MTRKFQNNCVDRLLHGRFPYTDFLPSPVRVVCDGFPTQRNQIFFFRASSRLILPLVIYSRDVHVYATPFHRWVACRYGTTPSRPIEIPSSAPTPLVAPHLRPDARHPKSARPGA